MQISFTFKDLKPCSTNKVWKKSRKGMYKSAEASSFEQAVYVTLLPQRAEIEKFERLFNVNDYHLQCSILIEVPKKILFTKAGYISSRNLDLDNILKNLIDAVFKNMNKLDDKYIRNFSHIESKVSKDDKYNINMVLKERSNKLLY